MSRARVQIMDPPAPDELPYAPSVARRQLWTECIRMRAGRSRFQSLLRVISPRSAHRTEQRTRAMASRHGDTAKVRAARWTSAMTNVRIKGTDKPWPKPSLFSVMQTRDDSRAARRYVLPVGCVVSPVAPKSQFSFGKTLSQGCHCEVPQMLCPLLARGRA